MAFLPPWCLPGGLAGCPINRFLPPWCLPGASSCFPGASLAPPRLSNGSLPASLVPPCGARVVASWAVQMVLGGPWLSPGQEKLNLALADYWSQLVLPWQIAGVIWSCLGRLLE